MKIVAIVLLWLSIFPSATLSEQVVSHHWQLKLIFKPKARVTRTTAVKTNPTSPEVTQQVSPCGGGRWTGLPVVSHPFMHLHDFAEGRTEPGHSSWARTLKPGQRSTPVPFCYSDHSVSLSDKLVQGSGARLWGRRLPAPNLTQTPSLCCCYQLSPSHPRSGS